LLIKEFGLNVFKPANGETVSINSRPNVFIQVPEKMLKKSLANCPSPSKKACPLDGFVYLDKEVCCPLQYLMPNYLSSEQ
jgi:hypothetical protein